MYRGFFGSTAVSKQVVERASLALAVVLVMVFVVRPAMAIDSGEDAPDFQLTSNSSSEISLSKYHGKIRYVDFWASWCSTCANSLTWMDQMQQRFGDDDLQVITVNVDEDRTDADEMLQRVKANIVVGYDPQGAVPARYNVNAMPTSYLIDRNGRVISVHEGLHDNDKHEIERQIRQIIDQEKTK